jgi:hypothetical protein
MRVKVGGMGEGQDNGLVHHYSLNLGMDGYETKEPTNRRHTSAGTVTVNQRTAELVLC